MDLVLHALYLIAVHKFLFLVPAVAGLVLLPRSGKRIALQVGLVILAILNMPFGMTVAGRMIHRFGEKGAATITRSFGTATRYNDHDVVGYHVLIRAAAGQVVETDFEDDDFNLYPPVNAAVYPGVGDRFNVYYPHRFPRDFMIVTNDDSPWATERRCDGLRVSLADANAKYEFDRTSQTYRAGYIAAIHAVLGGGCVNDAEREAFAQDIANANAGLP